MFNKIIRFIFIISIFLLPVTGVHAQGDMEKAIGAIKAPPGVKQWQADSGADIGILYFISSMVKISMAVAGVWTLYMFVLAGYKMIFSQGKSGSFREASGYFTNGVIGLALIASAYTITGVISFIIFGDSTYVLNPKFLIQ